LANIQKKKEETRNDLKKFDTSPIRIDQGVLESYRGFVPVYCVMNNHHFEMSPAPIKDLSTILEKFSEAISFNQKKTTDKATPFMESRRNLSKRPSRISLDANAPSCKECSWDPTLATMTG